MQASVTTARGDKPPIVDCLPRLTTSVDAARLAPNQCESPCAGVTETQRPPNRCPIRNANDATHHTAVTGHSKHLAYWHFRHSLVHKPVVHTCLHACNVAYPVLSAVDGCFLVGGTCLGVRISGFRSRTCGTLTMSAPAACSFGSAVDVAVLPDGTDARMTVKSLQDYSPYTTVWDRRTESVRRCR